MTRNFIGLDELHEMFTAADIEHRYTPGDTVITVIRGVSRPEFSTVTHVWTVSGNHVIYWADGIDVCKSRCREFAWTADAFDYIVDVYSKAE